MTNMTASIASASTAINIAKVGKSFGTLNVLNSVSTRIENHEFVSVLGPSGCGKSTLLRLISGLIPYDAGKIDMLGETVDAPTAKMGFVFQTSNLLPWLNIRDNLMLGLDLDPNGETINERAFADLVETLGLTGFEQSLPHQLSGGMKQRVAIGQALIRNPPILLMDEPFGALDALTRDRLNVELLRIWQKEKKTVLLVTHSISEAVLLSDRVLVMSERPGTIIEDVKIDLPRPRDPSKTREDPAFGDYVVKLSRLMGVD